MKTFKNLSAKNIFSAGLALLMITSIGSVYAEEGDITQTRTQERTRTELNSPVPGSDFAQSRNREEHTERYQNQNQQQNQYKYTNQYRNGDNNSASGSMNRENTTNHYMQGNAATGSMSRQNTAGHSIGGSRR